MTVSPADRFRAKYAAQPSGCWEWTSGRNSAGYGLFWLDGTMQCAHRVSYEMANGPIPPGLWLDHLCLNRACVNPSHLEAVTPAENTRRGPALTRSAEKQRARTHCNHGHPFSGSNLAVRPSGKRACRACCAASSRRHRARVSA